MNEIFKGASKRHDDSEEDDYDEDDSFVDDGAEDIEAMKELVK